MKLSGFRPCSTARTQAWRCSFVAAAPGPRRSLFAPKATLLKAWWASTAMPPEAGSATSPAGATWPTFASASSSRHARSRSSAPSRRADGRTGAGPAGNPGGEFGAALTMADLFLSEGVIVTVCSREGEPRRYEATPAARWRTFPWLCSSTTTAPAARRSSPGPWPSTTAPSCWASARAARVHAGADPIDAWADQPDHQRVLRRTRSTHQLPGHRPPHCRAPQRGRQQALGDLWLKTDLTPPCWPRPPPPPQWPPPRRHARRSICSNETDSSGRPCNSCDTATTSSRSFWRSQGAPCRDGRQPARHGR